MPNYETAPATICTIQQIRAFDRALADSAKYTDTRISAAIAAAEQTLEAAAMVAFVPRSKTASLIGDGTSRLMVPDMELRSVEAVTVSGSAMSAPEIAALKVRDWGMVEGAYWPNGAEIEITYTHGWQTPPAPIVNACAMLVVDELVPTGVSARATAATVGDQMFRLTVAGRDGDTGIPYVDAAIKSFGRKRQVVG